MSFVRRAVAPAARQSQRSLQSAADTVSLRPEAMPPAFHEQFEHWSHTDGAAGFPKVNARYIPDFHKALPSLGPVATSKGPSDHHWDETWSQNEIASAAGEHTMLTWGPSQPAAGLPQIVHAEGVYVYDAEGKQYLDWTSQAVSNSFGHTVPPQVMEAVQRQMESVPYIYGGLGMVPVRARLSQLLAELTPGDISGFLFPSGGSEANECAINMARRFTGREKILSQYRSYHGGTGSALNATGDFRRWFTQSLAGFVKIFNPQPMGFSFGKTDEEAALLCLQVLEEQILLEGPKSIAAIMLESVVGSGGVLVPPTAYMQGVRALCDKYDILLILDEVMAGFGRTGEMFAFQHFEGVIPDIVTSAKGITGGILPMSMVGVREKIRQHFLREPLGWGSTYQAHPASVACAYECVKLMVRDQLPQRAKRLQPVMMREIQALVERHESVKQGRAIGLFGCMDLQGLDGRAIQVLGGPSPPPVMAFRQAMVDNGLMGFFRPPLLHCCPPLIIDEDQLVDGFDRLSKSLTVLDKSIQEPSMWMPSK